MPKPDKLGEIIDSLKLPTEQHDLDACAKVVLDFVGSVDPTWAKRIEILKNERHFTWKDIATSLIAYPLDHSMHMEITANPQLQRAGIGAKPLEPVQCLQCGVDFKPRYAGARQLCSNRCANGYDAAQNRLKAEADRERVSTIPPGIEPTTVEQRMEGEQQPPS